MPIDMLTVELPPAATADLDSLLARISDGFIALDREGTVRRVNESAATLIGVSTGRMLSRSLWDLVPGGAESVLAQAVARTLEEGRPGVAQFFHTRTDTWWDVRTFPAAYGGDMLITDITERQTAEFALERTRQRYRTLFENTTAGIWDQDHSRIFQELERLRASGVRNLREYIDNQPGLVEQLLRSIGSNDMNRAILGLLAAPSPDDLIDAIPKLYGPETHAVIVDQLDAMWQGRKFFQSELKLEIMDGRTAHFLFSLPLPETIEEARHTPVCYQNIDLLKQVEREVVAAREAAEHANAAKTRFLAAASHDLRQPLQAAMLFHNLLSSQLSEKPHKDMADRLAQSLEGLHDMFTALLDVSRLDAGVVDVELADVALGPIIGRLSDDLGAQARAAGLDFQVVNSALNVRSDPRLLGRIIQNFMSNAVNHTEKGGRVLVGARRQGDRVAVQVWNTGPGIPPDQLRAIFEEFHQLKNPTRDRRQGLGLGLAIVDRLSRLLSHPVAVRSVADKATVFQVSVPIVSKDREEKPDAPPNAGVDEDMRFDGRSAIVLDDEPNVLDAIRMTFESLGFSVSAAESLEDLSAQWVDMDAPDLIVSDYRLSPEVDGIQAIGRIREHFGRDVPAMLVTGDTSPERIQEATRSGYRLLHKPVQSSDIVKAVADLLDGVPNS